MQLLPPVLRLMLLPVLNVLGPIIIGFSLSMLIPLALSLWKNDGASAGFEIAFCITFFTGLLMWLLTRRYKRELIPRDGFLLVTMAWVLLALAATIPLYVNIEGISFVLRSLRRLPVLRRPAAPFSQGWTDCRSA